MSKTGSTEWLRRSKIVAVGCAIAAATACGESANSGPEAGAAAATGGRAEAMDSPITVAGCLQRGDGSNFILTRINEPSQSVGTAGTASQSGVRSGDAAGTVEREVLRSAAGAYRVDAADGMDLAALVGKEVRVVGTIKENMDLPRANAERDPVQVKEGDLARIAATSIAQTAAECQGAESPAGAPGPRPTARP